jgi:hypothetical protein
LLPLWLGGCLILPVPSKHRLSLEELQARRDHALDLSGEWEEWIDGQPSGNRLVIANELGRHDVVAVLWKRRPYGGGSWPWDRPLDGGAAEELWGLVTLGKGFSDPVSRGGENVSLDRGKSSLLSVTSRPIPVVTPRWRGEITYAFDLRMIRESDRLQGEIRISYRNRKTTSGVGPEAALEREKPSGERPGTKRRDGVKRLTVTYRRVAL